MHTLTCPACGHRMTVSDTAPRQLLCSHCFRWMQNPQGVTAPLPPQISFPLDDQVHRDRNTGRIAIIALAGLVLIGLILLWNISRPITSFLTLLVILFTALLIFDPAEAGTMAKRLLRILALIAVIFGLFILLILSMCGAILRM